jgi:hypothetical protein
MRVVQAELLEQALDVCPSNPKRPSPPVIPSAHSLSSRTRTPCHPERSEGSRAHSTPRLSVSSRAQRGISCPFHTSSLGVIPSAARDLVPLPHLVSRCHPEEARDLVLLPHLVSRCHPERSEGSAFRGWVKLSELPATRASLGNENRDWQLVYPCSPNNIHERSRTTRGAGRQRSSPMRQLGASPTWRGPPSLAEPRVISAFLRPSLQGGPACAERIGTDNSSVPISLSGRHRRTVEDLRQR